MSSTQSAVYSEVQAKKANLTKERLGLSSWEEAEVAALQTKIGAKPADGWFGPESIVAWKAWAKTNDPKPVSAGQEGHLADTTKPVWPGQVIIAGVSHVPPAGVKIVNYLEPNGIPAQVDDTSERQYPVFEFVLHRGAENRSSTRNYAEKTEDILDARGLSTTFSMDIDGTIYQHFDPAIRAGRHASHHNRQSDSLDVGGPFSSSAKPEAGQVSRTFKAAIGREGDNLPPTDRKYGQVKCWTLPPAQVSALAAFLVWYCPLRGIPATACEDMRTFRLGGAAEKDPVTNVKGILAHAQISGPGQRVDGFVELLQVKESGIQGITWRTGADFFKT